MKPAPNITTDVNFFSTMFPELPREFGLGRKGIWLYSNLLPDPPVLNRTHGRIEEPHGLDAGAHIGHWQSILVKIEA
jgi:hypothetical protein